MSPLATSLEKTTMAMVQDTGDGKEHHRCRFLRFKRNHTRMASAAVIAAMVKNTIAGES
jgi:hypothetical protein